jgi:hypothetical protein
MSFEEDHEWTRAELRKLNVPRATYFRTFYCEQPECGPHFLLFDRDHMPLAEMVMGRDNVPDVIRFLRENFT